MIMAAHPTPTPTTNLPTVICAREKADACMIDPSKKSTLPMYNASFLPYLSAGRPATTAPIKAPPDVMDVMSSCSLEDSVCPRSSFKFTRTAEMTPVS